MISSPNSNDVFAGSVPPAPAKSILHGRSKCTSENEAGGDDWSLAAGWHNRSGGYERRSTTRARVCAVSSDGHKAYLEAVEVRWDIDYAMLVKLYGATSEGAKRRYSPVECIGARKEIDRGQPQSQAHQYVLC